MKFSGIGSEAVPALISALQDPRERVHWEAAKALGEIGDPAAAPALVTALEDESFSVRWVAADGLIAMGREALGPLLLALVERSRSELLREGAHRILQSSLAKDTNGDLRRVLAALDGPAPAEEVPFAAESALEKMSGKRSG